MITIAGKIFSVLLFFVTPLFAAHISLQITTMDGAPLAQATVGQPFLLHVVVKNTTNSAQYPTLKGVDKFNVHPSGFQMNMVNGTTSITYHYRMRIDSPGVYTIGPASIQESQGTVESAPLSITVAQEQKTDAKKTTAHTASFLRFSADKQQVMVGQKVHCTLAFYTTNPGVSLQNIIEPDTDQGTHYTAKAKIGPISGVQMINGTEHRYAQWEWDICPKSAGSAVIPAYAADYSIQTRNPSMFSFFVGRSDTKRVYSNTLTLTVDPLPDPNRSIHLVGSIDRVDAKLAPTTAKVGEGMVLTITLNGEADFDQLAFLPLQNMPNELKWYESKQFTQPSKTNSAHSMHSMEYIIQALKPGTYQIPEQTVHYFDTQERRYKTMSTVALTFQAHGQAVPAVACPTSSCPELENLNARDDIRPLHHEGPWAAQPIRSISWAFYWLLISAMAIIWLLIIIHRYTGNWLQPVVARIKKKSPYTHARKQIQALTNTDHYDRLYSIFLDLAAHVNPASQISALNIEHMLANAGASAIILQEWRLFFEQLEQARYAYHTASSHPDLIAQSLYWIDVLQKLSHGVTHEQI